MGHRIQAVSPVYDGAADRNHRNQWLCMNLVSGEIAAPMRGVGKGSVVYVYDIHAGRE